MAGKPIRLTIIFALIGAVAGSGIVIAVKMPQRIEARKKMEEMQERQRRQDLKIDIADLKIPSEYQELLKNSYYPFRPRMERWTEKEASHFWTDPGEVGSICLKRTTKRSLRIFSGMRHRQVTCFYGAAAALLLMIVSCTVTPSVPEEPDVTGSDPAVSKDINKTAKQTDDTPSDECAVLSRRDHA